MQRREVQGLTLLGAAMAMMLALSVGASEPAKPPRPALSEAVVASRIENLSRLIKTSSGARRVDASDHALARQHKQEATDLLEQAQAAFKKKDLEGADKLLDEATQAMFRAVRDLGPSEEGRDKALKDFENRASSVRVLLEALTRISEQEGSKAQAAETVANVQAEVERARSMLVAGEVAEGRQVLDAAYETAKLAVESLRQGDTVVRTLHFETRQDEYRYELDRNDTHQMLIQVLLEEKRQQVSVDEMVKQFLERAQVLRTKAESQADKGDFDAAIKTLEESTKELVRAIRGAGIYIPG